VLKAAVFVRVEVENVEDGQHQLSGKQNQKHELTNENFDKR
jgi:hypothetical protein